MVLISLLISFPLKARGLLLCPERQSKQNALLCQRSERGHNHRFGFYQVDSYSTFSAHLCDVFKCILIGDYSISALCFKGALFRTSLFKTAFLCLFATSLLSQSLISSFTLRCHYSLPTQRPTVVGRCYVLFFSLDRAGLMLTSRLI